MTRQETMRPVRERDRKRESMGKYWVYKREKVVKEYEKGEKDISR